MIPLPLSTNGRLRLPILPSCAFCHSDQLGILREAQRCCLGGPSLFRERPSLEPEGHEFREIVKQDLPGTVYNALPTVAQALLCFSPFPLWLACPRGREKRRRERAGGAGLTG
jgi:hypothetical protein